MKTKTFEITVNPKVIKWAIETSGWKIEELSKKLKVSRETIESWLKGQKNPTLKQLENLAKYVKRPLSAFFLQEPPKEKPLPKDYRALPIERRTFSRETILAIRSARRLQKIGKLLMENLRLSTKPSIKDVNIKIMSPQEVAKEYRGIFQINEETIMKLKDAYEAFNFLRKKIEELNIFVFQLPMPIDDARGFTLADEEPIIIVINSKEKIEARIFTLMHELGHVLLREASVDMPEESLISTSKLNIKEKWCNEFASEFLFPDHIAKNVFKEKETILKQEETLKQLSRKYKISKTMLLYKMLKLGYINKKDYEDITKRLKSSERQGFIDPTKKCLVEKGEKFISLTEANLEKGEITFDQALEYLGLKSKHYEKVISLLKR